MASTLTRWLRTLDPQRLAALLRNRPETRSAPLPRDLGELAGRLQGRLGVAAAFQSVPLPAVQVLETVVGYGCRRRAELAALLGEPGLDATLSVLAGYALLWELDGELAMPGEVRGGLGYPLGFGPPAAALLDTVPVAQLRELAAALSLDVPPLKKAILRVLAAHYADPDALRRLVASAPADARELLDATAWHGPLVRDSGAFPGAQPRRGPVGWAVRHGLLLPDGWQHLAMPREVALAVRGPDWRPPFQPEPPVPALLPAEASAVAREAAAAAGALVDQVGAVLAAAPVVLLKAGGVGSREQRRLAKATGVDEPGVRLAVELGCAAGLLARGGGAARTGRRDGPDELLPTEGYDGWLAGEPADRLVPLLVAWYGLPAVPLRDGTALLREPAGQLAAEVRADLLSGLARLPEGQGLADPAGYLTESLAWRLPVLAGALDDPAGTVGPLWSEAVRLGVVAHGALSPLGRALVGPDGAALAAAARELLAGATGTAIFQADLTALVPGTPSAALADLLGTAADLETRGTASTWRFSAGSVRRALDAGYTAERLAADLAAVAAGGALPQPLTYLLHDVARRHGTLRVRSVACVLHAGDPALLAELVANRALTGLALRTLGPTVLVSAKPADQTLAALRSAGYAPVGEDADGQQIIERAARRRASRPPASHQPVRPADPLADPAELAAALLATPSTAAPARAARRGRPDTLELVSRHAAHLDAGEQQLLAYAIDTGSPVRIQYTDSNGRTSHRVIEPIDFSGNALEAWCQLRDDERMFILDRIDAVAPA